MHAHCPFEPQTWPVAHDVEVHTHAPLALHAGVEPVQGHTHVSAAPHVGVVPLQTAQFSLVPPHAAAPLPSAHVPEVAPGATEQQPPLHVPTHLVPQVPLTHAWSAGHWLSAVQPHTPVGSPLGKHPGVPPLQLVHAPPLEPHAFGAVPPTHVPVVPFIWQHPPMHGTDAEQVVSQVCVELQATFEGQSVVAELQPHAPPVPPAAAMHAVPTLAPAQVWHIPPVFPHADGASPSVHTPAVPPSGELQQPPLHGCDTSHALVQVYVRVSHASPCGQSLATLQPQLPVDAMHAAPASPAAQLLHIVPAAPHAVLVSGEVQVVPLQQVPLHGWLDEHCAVHAWVTASQAWPTAQSLDPVQPPASGDPASIGAASAGASSGGAASVPVPVS